MSKQTPGELALFSYESVPSSGPVTVSVSDIRSLEPKVVLSDKVRAVRLLFALLISMQLLDIILVSSRARLLAKNADFVSPVFTNYHLHRLASVSVLVML
jgi:hypothetical protein